MRSLPIHIWEIWIPNFHVNPHSLRHFGNTLADLSEIPKEIITAWSGRVDKEQTNTYIHTSHAGKSWQGSGYHRKAWTRQTSNPCGYTRTSDEGTKPASINNINRYLHSRIIYFTLWLHEWFYLSLFHVFNQLLCCWRYKSHFISWKGPSSSDWKTQMRVMRSKTEKTQLRCRNGSWFTHEIRCCR